MRVGKHNASYKIAPQSTICQPKQIAPDPCQLREARRFWAKVRKTDTCWQWTASVSGGVSGNPSKQYGQFTIGPRRARRSIGAHVYSYIAANGPIPEGQQIRHTCDNSRCVRPDHMVVGSFKQNMEDAADRGRLHTPRPSRHKLTPEQCADVIAYVKSHGRGAGVEMACRYDVTPGFISALVNGQRRLYDVNVQNAGKKAS